MSEQLDNPLSSVYSYLSDDNDKPDLQQTLIEESWQRRLNYIRLRRLKQAQQRYRCKTKKVSATALLKQIKTMIVRLQLMMWLLLIWLNQITTVVCISYASISIFLISSSYNKI